MVVKQKIITNKQQHEYLLENNVNGHLVYNIVRSCPSNTEADDNGYCKVLKTGELSDTACPALKPYYFKLGDSVICTE